MFYSSFSSRILVKLDFLNWSDTRISVYFPAITSGTSLRLAPLITIEFESTIGFSIQMLDCFGVFEVAVSLVGSPSPGRDPKRGGSLHLLSSFSSWLPTLGVCSIPWLNWLGLWELRPCILRKYFSYSVKLRCLSITLLLSCVLLLLSVILFVK